MPFLAATPRLTEKAWQGQVLTLARMFGWRAYHTYDSRRCVAGFPDLVLVRRPRVLFVELKTDRGRLSQSQREWLDALRDCHVEVYVWRPADVERVTEILR